MKDDNQTPINAFLWAANRKDGPDVWFCHIWKNADDYRYYTALWNTCAVPEFLAGLTDKEPVCSILKYRSFELYGFFPSDQSEPVKPDGYDGLVWVQPHPAVVRDLKGLLRQRLRDCRKSRAAKSACKCGWKFSDFQRDPEFADA
jgi:hypothetical protein